MKGFVSMDNETITVGLSDVEKFTTPEVAALFSENEKREVIIIQVGGQLVNDGPQIMGDDVMIIVK